MNKQHLFETNENLIYSRAWHYSKKYNIDFEELKSEGYRIFCEAVERFEQKRSKFSTFLFHRLRTIEDYCQKTKLIDSRQEPFMRSFSFSAYSPCLGDSIESDISYLGLEVEKVTHEEETKLLERIAFEQAVEKLSRDGKKIIAKMIYGDFHNSKAIRQRTIGKDRIKEKMGWPENRVNHVWGELKEWWTDFQSEIIM
jgi:RNA polymerase sigma factor (sigma-70 family)